MLFAFVIALLSIAAAIAAGSVSSTRQTAAFKVASSKTVNAEIDSLAVPGPAVERSANLRKILADPAVSVMHKNTKYATSESQFLVYQSILGFTLDTFEEDTELYTTTFKQAIAATMEDGMSTSDISDFIASETAGSGSYSTDIFYTVIVPATSTMEAFLTAASDGTFDDLLHQYAIDNGAAALTTANSYDPYATAVVDTSSDDDASMEMGTIIGICVGGFAFCIILNGLLYLLCANRGGVSSGTVVCDNN